MYCIKFKEFYSPSFFPRHTAITLLNSFLSERSYGSFNGFVVNVCIVYYAVQHNLLYWSCVFESRIFIFPNIFGGSYSFRLHKAIIQAFSVFYLLI